MQIITRVDGLEVEQNIEGLNKEQALLLAEQALSKPQTLASEDHQAKQASQWSASKPRPLRRRKELGNDAAGDPSTNRFYRSTGSRITMTTRTAS